MPRRFLSRDGQSCPTKKESKGWGGFQGEKSLRERLVFMMVTHGDIHWKKLTGSRGTQGHIRSRMRYGRAQPQETLWVMVKV